MQNTILVAIDFTNITNKQGISTKDLGYITHNFDKYWIRIGYFAMVPRNDYVNETDDLSLSNVFTNQI